MLSHPDTVLTVARERQRDAEERARALDLARAHDRGRSLLAQVRRLRDGEVVSIEGPVDNAAMLATLGGE